MEERRARESWQAPKAINRTRHIAESIADKVLTENQIYDSLFKNKLGFEMAGTAFALNMFAHVE